CQQDYRHPLTF
nr:immunoglobulin light chain junction region [Macaca mulatta]